MTVLVDTNVILDIVTDDPVFKPWSLGQMNRLAVAEDLAINDIIFAELAPGFDDFEKLTDAVDSMGLDLRPIPRAALYLAGRVHQDYRSRGGKRESVLPDFFIAAQAAVEGLPLLTRDTRRFHTYFPTLELISP